MSRSTLRLPPRAMEIVPLADRLRWLLAVRVCLVLGAFAAGWAVRPWPTAPERSLLVCGALLLSGSLLLHPLAVRYRRLARWAITVPVLLDGLYLAWALYLTGGLTGPITHLVVLHLIAVTLLASFRTGMKLAFWHCLVVMAVLEAVSAGVLPPLDGATGFNERSFAVFLATVWLTTATTASLAAVNERELRRRRYDEAALRQLGRALHEARTDWEVVTLLLGFAVDAADAPLAAVSWWPDLEDAPTDCHTARSRAGGDAELLVDATAPAPGSLLDTAIRRRQTMLAAVRGPDRWVGDVLGEPARVVVVPFAVDGELSGALAIEHRARAGSRIEQRRVGVLEQAVAHAATALTRAALLEQLQRSALTDRLTGVANRRAFDAALERELAAAARNDTPLAVLIVDLDHFKSINDTFGHAAGDDVLRAVGAALRSSVRAGDHAARYGGEEFAVVLPGAGRADAAAAARRVLAAVRAITEPRPMTASLGVSLLAEHGHSATELLSAADRALYAAKTGGRDQARFAGVSGPLPEQHDADAAASAVPAGRPYRAS